VQLAKQLVAHNQPVIGVPKCDAFGRQFHGLDKIWRNFIYQETGPKITRNGKRAINCKARCLDQYSRRI